jgi:hypothetical protein
VKQSCTRAPHKIHSCTWTQDSLVHRTSFKYMSPRRQYHICFSLHGISCTTAGEHGARSAQVTSGNSVNSIRSPFRNTALNIPLSNWCVYLLPPCICTYHQTSGGKSLCVCLLMHASGRYALADYHAWETELCWINESSISKVKFKREAIGVPLPRLMLHKPSHISISYDNCSEYQA